jgi:pyrimidine operon attenuation protein/uracil phosphoribosyltransferase
MNDKKILLNKEVAEQKLHRMALEVAEQLTGDEAELVLIGVRNSGMVVAEHIGALLKEYISGQMQVISVSFDKHEPKEIMFSKEIDFNGKNILVIDDVSNSGKTLLYTMKPLLSFSPKRIQTLVLVERMHKLFPIKPDYVGMSVATTSEDYITVEVQDSEIIGAYVN